MFLKGRVAAIAAILPFFLCSQKASLSFENTSLKFGNTIAGKPLYISYPFHNTGSLPVIISEVTAGCNCTKPSWPATPVFPGQQDTVFVEVDTGRMIGWQDRTLLVHSNAQGSPHKLRFKIMVKQKPEK